MLELLGLLCSIILQHYTSQGTIHWDSSATVNIYYWRQGYKGSPAFRPTSHLRCGHKVYKSALCYTFTWEIKPQLITRKKSQVQTIRCVCIFVEAGTINCRFAICLAYLCFFAFAWCCENCTETWTGDDAGLRIWLNLQDPTHIILQLKEVCDVCYNHIPREESNMNYTDLGTRFGLMLASCCIWTTETRTEWSSDTVLDYPALLKPKLFLVPGCEVVLVGKRI